MQLRVLHSRNSLTCSAVIGNPDTSRPPSVTHVSWQQDEQCGLRHLFRLDPYTAGCGISAPAQSQGPVHLESTVERVALGRILLPTLRLSHGSIIPSVLYTLHSFQQLSASLDITLDETVQRQCVGWYSTVGIATTLRAGRSGNRISVEARFSTLVQTGPGAHPASCTMGTGSFPEESGWGAALTTHRHLAPRLKEE